MTLRYRASNIKFKCSLCKNDVDDFDFIEWKSISKVCIIIVCTLINEKYFFFFCKIKANCRTAIHNLFVSCRATSRVYFLHPRATAMIFTCTCSLKCIFFEY
jgi:hypothetical protein